MEIKKKYLSINTVVLLVFVLLSLLGLSTICYADMSSEYLDYSLNTFKDNFTYTDSAKQEKLRNICAVLLNDPTSKATILQNFNNQLSSWDISNINDRNIIITYSHSTSYSNYGQFRFFVCNNSVPNGYDDLDFFKLTLLGNTSIKFSKNNTSSTDYIYVFSCIAGVNSSNIINSLTFSNNQFTTSSDYFSFDIGSSYYSTSSDSVLICSNVACCGLPSGYASYPFTNSSSAVIIPIILQDPNGNFQPVTPSPSGDIPVDTGNTGTITNVSGETIGQIDLSGIQSGIGTINQNLNNVQNQISGDTQKLLNNQNQNTQTIVNTISGETQKITNTLTESADMDSTTITSGDIQSSLGFELATDPYANFWLEMVNGLRTSLTGVNRTLSINFMGNTYTINLDNFAIQIPTSLKTFLSLISSVLVFWKMIKWWKIIIDELTSGNMDEVLAMNEEERYY